MASAVILVFVAYSVGDKIFSPWLGPTPAVKMQEAVVRPVSHIPSFGGHIHLTKVRDQADRG